MKLDIIIGCEESQTICKALRRRGHNAFSCDLLPCSGGHPEWHFQGDIFDVIKYRRWDLGIFHPECTRLTVAANKYYGDKYRHRFPNIHREREEAVRFFLALTEFDLPHWAIENPIGIMSKLYRKPDQIIQPYQFGDRERKSTCLWVKDLPALQPTDVVSPDLIYHESGRTDSRLHFSTLKLPKEERRKARSVTFQGIADAIADQWPQYIINKRNGNNS